MAKAAVAAWRLVGVSEKSPALGSGGSSDLRAGDGRRMGSASAGAPLAPGGSGALQPGRGAAGREGRGLQRRGWRSLTAVVALCPGSAGFLRQRVPAGGGVGSDSRSDPELPSAAWSRAPAAPPAGLGTLCRSPKPRDRHRCLRSHPGTLRPGAEAASTPFGWM